ncbi:hypothetical protein [Psychroserpens sp. Hel_I_66]|uniref:hypothetical protein n=1 Tax=Psychroserpens sp. Hel_I_66 TaxID=1250004 RepID=UPI000648D3EA|nr:hypothetical protein [Psychroserpens sp. Hel_I_66]
MKKFLSFISVVLFANMAFAQYSWTDAEVHTKDGKVFDGEAKLTMISQGINLSKEKLKYRTKSKKNKTKFQPTDIDYVIFTINYRERVNGERIVKTRTEKYIPVFLNNKQTRIGFVELMVDGNLQLVGRTVRVQNAGTWQPGVAGPSGLSAPVYMPGYMGSHNQVMILREGSKPQIFNQVSLTKSFRKRAMEYFEDCPVLKAKIEKKEFVKEDLQDIVNFYNSSCN